MSNLNHGVSRRRFVGGLAAAFGYASMQPPLWARSVEAAPEPGRGNRSADNYDQQAKLCFNENPWGPPESVLKAMTDAFKYANRYGYPDGGITQAIASLHGVQGNNIMLGAGSTEILDIVGSAFIEGHKKVIGVEPTFSTVYTFATGIKGSSIKLPLLADYRQDIPAIIKAAKDNHPNVAFVYICNPNNPTGAIVTKQEIKKLLDELPEGVPVLIDEAYHHFVEDPNYETSIPYVQQGRPVIVARTFSKIVGLAGIRLGYGVAPANLMEKMQPYSSGFSVNACAKLGGVAALKDTAAQAKVKADTLRLRKKAVTELDAMGFKSIPSEANFFMVNVKRPVNGVISEFAQRGVLVGRPFPPMMEHLRVSVGTDEEMARFMDACKEILKA